MQAGFISTRAAIAIAALTLGVAGGFGLFKGCSSGSSGNASFVAPAVVMDAPKVLSVTPTTGVDGEAAFKGKLMAMTYPVGEQFETALVAVYGDAAGPDVWKYDGSTRKARDLFVTRSTDDGATWSQPVNISNLAGLTSIAADHDGDPTTAELPFFGDCGKPNVFNSGKTIIVNWISNYSGTAGQGTVALAEFGLVEIPYAAVYSSRSTNGGVTWSRPQQVTDATRDAKQITSRGNDKGFMVIWQEDPQGLQPGQAEGPGEGGSGAKVSKGTDAWKTQLALEAFKTGVPFPAPQRITDNFLNIDKDGYETGKEGASRPQLALVGGTAIVAYEETKGSEGIDFGKFIRYHVFSAFSPSAPDATAGVGYIISNPAENARRVRMLVQGTAGPVSGIRLSFIWKEGAYDQGGPSDIMVRSGYQDANDPSSTGFRTDDLIPAVDPLCTDPVQAANNDLAINLSSNKGPLASTEENPFEDARAHRGVLQGDNLLLGYSRTDDWAVARYTDLENYDFFIRRSTDGGKTFEPAKNLSRLDDKSLNVKEPRIVKPMKSPDPADLRNPDVIFVAWGTEVNYYEHRAPSLPDLDIFITRTTNFGVNYETVQPLADGPSSQAESQLRVAPDGRTVWATWMDFAPDGSKGDVLFRVGRAKTPEPPAPPATP